MTPDIEQWIAEGRISPAWMHTVGEQRRIRLNLTKREARTLLTALGELNDPALAGVFERLLQATKTLEGHET